jgi:hypothetical protein
MEPDYDQTAKWPEQLKTRPAHGKPSSYAEDFMAMERHDQPRPTPAENVSRPAHIHKMERLVNRHPRPCQVLDSPGLEQQMAGQAASIQAAETMSSRAQYQART